MLLYIFYEVTHMNENIRKTQDAVKHKFHTGDRVIIPGSLIFREDPAEAIIQKIYPYYVSLKLVRPGYTVSLSFDELKNLKVIKKYTENTPRKNKYNEVFDAINKVNAEYDNLRMTRRKIIE